MTGHFESSENIRVLGRSVKEGRGPFGKYLPELFI